MNLAKWKFERWIESVLTKNIHNYTHIKYMEKNQAATPIYRCISGREKSIAYILFMRALSIMRTPQNILRIGWLFIYLVFIMEFSSLFQYYFVAIALPTYKLKWCYRLRLLLKSFRSNSISFIISQSFHALQ